MQDALEPCGYLPLAAHIGRRSAPPADSIPVTLASTRQHARSR